MMLLAKRFINLFSQLTPFKASQEMIRLSKWMSLKSICSRKQAEELIKLGLVRVDGKRIFENMIVPYQSNLKAFTPIGIKVQKPITKLWMINKPRGYICTHKDPQKRKTIYSLLPASFQQQFGHLMTVGRLDFNSEGLLLITNDVILKNLLQNPEANLQRVYRVKVHGRVTDEKLDKMVRPMMIKGQQYGPLNVNVDRSLSTNVWLNISMKTGKNRQIRRIMQKCDLQVNKLIRTAYGPYKIGALNHGEIAEIPISQGLDRKLKKVKARNLIQNKTINSCLIEVDIRNRAIGLAKEQLRIRSQQLKKQSLDKKAQKQQQAKKLIQEESQDVEQQ